MDSATFGPLPAPSRRRRKGSLSRFSLVAAAACLPVLGSLPARALSFNFNCVNAASTSVVCSDPNAFSQEAYNGFLSAGQRWSSLFSDPITVNLNIGFELLGQNILAEAGSTSQKITYSQFLNALNADKTSADDMTAYNSLQKTDDVDLLINRTRNNPNGRGSRTPYLDNDADANNTIIDVNTANLKALGLLGDTTTPDADIAFSTAFSWDFDPSDGITSGLFDFIGIAAHEIGHALGFVSGVDVLDFNSFSPFFLDNQFTFVSPLDLYRYSDLSRAQASGIIDWTADTREKYFSIDGGNTSLGTFSTGVFRGDGRQASHWKDDLGLGIMDPTADFGELLTITPLDVRAFDVIGYDLPSQGPSPSPSSSVPGPLPVFGIAAAFGWSRRLRKRLQPAKHTSSIHRT